MDLWALTYTLRSWIHGHKMVRANTHRGRVFNLDVFTNFLKFLLQHGRHDGTPRADIRALLIWAEKQPDEIDAWAAWQGAYMANLEGSVEELEVVIEPNVARQRLEVLARLWWGSR